MSEHARAAELDLDEPGGLGGADERRGEPLPAGPGVTVLGLALVGLAVGALAGALLTPPARPRLPPVASLSVRDLYVDVATPAAGGSGASGGRQRVGTPTLALRLLVENPGAVEARFTELTVDGGGRRRITVPLRLRVPARGRAMTDVTILPDCVGLQLPAVAGLRPAPGTGFARSTVPVALARGLGQPGAICQLFEATMPRGWRAPIIARSTRLVGQDLQVTVSDLSAERLNGILVEDRLLPTVFVGDQLLSTSAKLDPGHDTVLRLRGPPPCIQASGVVPMPSTMRLLATSEGGLQPKLVVVGPALTRWLRLACSG
jgi:hypothetical protein